MAKVSIQSIEKSFLNPDGTAKKIFDNFSLDIKSGSFVMLKGRSGSGKSTLFNLISGLILPESGEINVGDIRINSLSESKRDNFRAENIGYIFQTFNLISALSVIENIYMPCLLTGNIKNEKYDMKSREILKKLDIIEHADKYPYQLSVGQRQRVAIGRTIFKRPRLILADEPTASLDLDSAKIVVESLIGLKEEGSTVLIASHDPIFDKFSPDIVYNIETREAVS